MNVLTPHETNAVVSQENTVFIDVRESAEYAAAHIPNSILAPLSKLENYQLPQGTKQAVVLCQKGVRAAKAINQLQARYKDVTFFNLEGGIDAWQSDGLDIAKQSHGGIPLDRQVQITIGSGVLLGTLLGIFVSIEWLWLSAFLGAVLLFTGLTGSGGLALLLARMPWNK